MRLIKHLVFSVFALFSICIFAFLSGGELIKLLDFTSFVLIIFLPSFLLLSIWSVKNIKEYYKIALFGADNKYSVKEAMHFFKTATICFFVAGILGFLISLICFFSISHNNLEIQILFSVALLPLLYSAILSGLFSIPFYCNAKKHLLSLRE